MKKITSWTKIPIIPLIITLLCFNACTTIHFKAIAPPPPSTKLHVAVLTITGDGGRYGYALTHEKWSDLMLKATAELLRDKGIYEVVSQKDVNYAVGTQPLSIDEYWWLKNDCALLKQYGKALYAEYAMLITRAAVTSMRYQYDIKFINIETGMLYSVSDSLGNTGSYERNVEIATKEIFPRMYRKLFHEAKGDLLATAMRKGRLMPAEEIKKPAAPETKLALVPPAAAKPVPAPPSVVAEKKPSPAVKTLTQPIPPVSKPPIKEEKLPLSTEPLPPKTTADVSIPKKDTALPSDEMIKKTIPDEKEDSVPPRMLAKISPPTPPAAAKPVPAPPSVVAEKKPSPAVKTLPQPIPPASKPPIKEEKLPLSTEPLPPKTTADVSTPKEDTVLPSDGMIKKTIPDEKEDSVPPRMLAKISPPTPPADLSGVATKRNEFEKKLGNGLQNKTPVMDKTRLVVYDFNANEQLQVVSLILSDALREELFTLGIFSLVNRENLVQGMQELSLQQSGLVDEKQVLKLGKWLAANESVTGRFAQFGNTYILQTKRTDLTTMNTLGFGSLKCTAGQEAELLAGLPELARKIAGLKK